MAGMLVGSLLCGVISDRLGRKITLLLSIGPLVVGGCLPVVLPSNPDYYFFLLLARLISGFWDVGAIILSL